MKKIVIKLQIEGVHSWPTCPIEEVEFLKYEHRHIFHIRIEKEVKHNDRDIEIIQFKRHIERLFTNRFYNYDRMCCYFGPWSCEDIAEWILKEFDLDSVEVLEDNENGAIITR